MRATLKTVLAGSLCALPLLFLAQTAGAADEAKPAAPPARKAAAAKPYTPPRTAWGDPDLRGRWPVDYLTATPRIRPPQFGTRAELTDDEYAIALRAAKQQQEVYAKEIKGGRMGMGHWTERGLPLRQTSLTVLPADGRMPAATPEGVKRAAASKSSWSEDHWDVPEDFSPFDRCITRGMPSSMLPGAYNMGIDVFQGPGYVAIRLEMIHETRIIPLDGRAAPPAGVKGWLGYSRGHWEGNTLVIETTNFEPGVPLGNASNTAKPVPNSDQLKVTERLTPTGPNEIRYEAYVEDPVVLTAPFKLDFPWRRNSQYMIYEYACHEGNVQERGFISSSRAQRDGEKRLAIAKAQQAQAAAGKTEE